MHLNETTLTDWYIVTFYDVLEPNRVLWGTVKDDRSNRCSPGCWVCTSPILNQFDDHAFLT